MSSHIMFRKLHEYSFEMEITSIHIRHNTLSVKFSLKNLTFVILINLLFIDNYISLNILPLFYLK